MTHDVTTYLIGRRGASRPWRNVVPAPGPSASSLAARTFSRLPSPTARALVCYTRAAVALSLAAGCHRGRGARRTAPWHFIFPHSASLQRFIECRYDVRLKQSDDARHHNLPSLWDQEPGCAPRGARPLGSRIECASPWRARTFATASLHLGGPRSCRCAVG